MVHPGSVLMTGSALMTEMKHPGSVLMTVAIGLSHIVEHNPISNFHIHGTPGSGWMRRANWNQMYLFLAKGGCLYKIFLFLRSLEYIFSYFSPLNTESIGTFRALLMAAQPATSMFLPLPSTPLMPSTCRLALRRRCEILVYHTYGATTNWLTWYANGRATSSTTFKSTTAVMPGPHSDRPPSTTAVDNYYDPCCLHSYNRRGN
ncbi:uncharacterized protein LACBIDRAFT_332795 [Laccaria bicolor S238N-H82]|uniref:Predicted protein n=1 Tax=Laccaria bicolor (strain S238N-H82 / ATCC MYA-4686) TaxID=486041 RepID=B0DTR1_LACBS|nr:uncharacterized protein LACBIDRAFT_332795 [Laccaria bicolor S238N-H82]EDR02026.1 predicted protein [Laccaria bicolor S238N-H82]|eukprot:XP_001887417.1 predicted protein [Laccaria bicolor S238N-H82]